MSLFDYLYACSFWQWVGTICLAGAVCGPVAGLGVRIRQYHQNAPRANNKGMNSGCTNTEHPSPTPQTLNLSRSDMSGANLRGGPCKKP